MMMIQNYQNEAFFFFLNKNKREPHAVHLLKQGWKAGSLKDKKFIALEEKSTLNNK